MYAIIEKMEFYGGEIVSRPVDGPTGQPEVFATKKEAEARVRALDGEVYRLAHNQASRGEYIVRKLRRDARGLHLDFHP